MSDEEFELERDFLFDVEDDPFVQLDKYFEKMESELMKLDKLDIELTEGLDRIFEDYNRE